MIQFLVSNKVIKKYREKKTKNERKNHGKDKVYEVIFNLKNMKP